MLAPRTGTDRKLVHQLTLDGGPVRPQPFVSGLLPSCGTSLRHCSLGGPFGAARVRRLHHLAAALHHPARLWHLTFQANMSSVHWYGAYKRETRSEEHTSELQSLMRISYAVFCLKKKKNNNRLT